MKKEILKYIESIVRKERLSSNVKLYTKIKKSKKVYKRNKKVDIE